MSNSNSNSNSSNITSTNDNNLNSVIIDVNDEGSLKRALVRTLGSPEILKINVSRESYEMWQDRIFDVIRQCKMELITIDSDERYKEFNVLLDRAIIVTSRLTLSNIETQLINQIRACYSFMRDQIESQLMISIKNMHTNGNPLDLIRALKTKFSPATQVTVFQSLQNLLSVKLISSETKNEFINRIKGLHQNVLRYNQTKTIEQLLDVLLNLVLYQSVEPNYQLQLKRDLYNDVNFSFIQAAKIVLAEEELVKLAKDKANNNSNNNSDNKSELKVNATMYNSKACDICKTTSSHYTSDCFYNLLNKNNKFNTSFKGSSNNINKPSFNGRRGDNYNHYKRKIQNNNISNNDNSTNELNVGSGEESDNYNNYSYNNNNDNTNKNKNNKRVRFQSQLNKYKNNNSPS
ncbi:MAG: hypothetical protein ACXW07_03810 [Nitrososphaeraceae archaeon]